MLLFQSFEALNFVPFQHIEVFYNFQKLFYQCICFQPNLRPSINEIKNILNEEINSLYFILQLLNDCELENNQTMVTQLIYENICLIYSTNDDSNVDKYLKHIYCMRSLFLSKIRNVIFRSFL